MNDSKKIALIALALASTALVPIAEAQQLVDLGRLPGGTWSFVSEISADGTAVAGTGNTAQASGARAWRWTAATGLSNLGSVSGAVDSYGYGMSGDGQAVIGASGSAYDTACRWTAGTGMQTLGSLAAGQPSFASDANTDGAVVFGYGYLAGGVERAFRWTSAGGMQQFGQLLPGTQHSVGLSMTADGSAYTGYCYNNAPALVYPIACRWTSAGVATSLGVLPGTTQSVPGSISDNGQVIVGYSNLPDGSYTRAFRWTAATGMQDLGTMAGTTGAVAGSVSADGSIILGYALAGADAIACIWTGAGGAQDLGAYLQGRGVNTTGWLFDGAVVSANGAALAGNGTRNGVTTAWYVSLGAPSCTAPTIVSNTGALSAASGTSVSLDVTATGTSLNYQWYHDTVLISGATGANYTIASAQPADTGVYTCTVSNTCGTRTTGGIALTVTTGGGGGNECPADFNHDGSLDPDDLGDFITCYFEPEPCEGTDFNDDGDVNPDDLGDYITAYFGSAC